jgi:hypothetical protein
MKVPKAGEPLGSAARLVGVFTPFCICNAEKATPLPLETADFVGV